MFLVPYARGLCGCAASAMVTFAWGMQGVLALCILMKMSVHVMQDSLALGVIFAATDSVAVLQVLRPDRAPLLYSLVFGEGVINDATAVALLRAVQVPSPDAVLQC